MLGQRTPECQLPAGITPDELWEAMWKQIYLNSRSEQTVYKKGPTTGAIWPGPDKHGLKTVLIDNRLPSTFSLIGELKDAPLNSGRVFIRNTGEGVDETLRTFLGAPDLRFKSKVLHMFVSPQTPRSEDSRTSVQGLNIFPVGNDSALKEVVKLRSEYSVVGTRTIRNTLATDILQSLENNEIRILLAQKDGQSIATATATNYGGLIGIMNVLTAENFRKQGIATALMQNLFDYYDKQNIAGYHLLSSEGAFNLYTRLGFKEADSACLYEWRKLSNLDRIVARITRAGEVVRWLSKQAD